MDSTRHEAGRGSVVARRESRLLIERLSKLLVDRGRTQRDVSRRAGLGLSGLNDILTSRNKNPSVPQLQAIAKELQTHLAYLIGESDDADWVPDPRVAQPIQVIGVAETGAYRAMASVERKADYPIIVGPPSKQYPAASRFALLVRDDAMNAAPEGPIAPGMYALCVDMEAAGLTIESRSVYACRRSLDGGRTFETTIRRAMVFADRVELLAESSRPGYEKLIISRDPSMELAAQINAIGLVYATLTSFEE